MMLSIPTMALAAAVGSGCPVNQANINQYSQALNHPGSQVYMQAQNGETDLSVLLDQMGVSCPGGLCDGLDKNCPTGSCGIDGACGFGANGCGVGAGARGARGCGNQNFGGFYR